MFKPNFDNYKIDSSLPTISISTILSMVASPFERDKVVDLTYNKHYNNPESQYYHKSKDEIIAMWEAKGADSRHYGTMLDTYIGNILTGTPDSLKLFKLDNNYEYDERLKGLCDSFDSFYKVLCASGDTEFIDREQTVYYKVDIPNPDNNDEILSYYVKGRFDALFYNKRTNKWIIVDWKSSGSIEKKTSPWTKKLLGPMNRFPELNWYTYTTQLYYYKKTLIANYLPAGTTEDDVIVLIVNLPGKINEESGQNFGVHQPAYKYDSLLLDQLYNYAIQKDYLNNKINSNKKEETKEIQKINEEESDVNLTNLF